jgi:hypothetical protein
MFPAVPAEMVHATPYTVEQIMSRLVMACVLFGSCCHAATSSEPLFPANATRYAAKIKYLKVDGGNQIMAVETEITGLKGTALKTTLGGKNGLTLKLEIQDVPGSKPSQYLAHFKLLETKGDKVVVLSAPAIVTTVGHPAKLMVGQEKGDRIEVGLTVREIASAATEPKATSDKPAKSKPLPASAAASSYGTSVMKMVNVPIVIQEEEEERLGIPLP